VKDQPLVTIGGATTGPLPIGALPIGPLPIGALPIGAFPTTGVGGGGWRTGKSAATAAPATPMVDAITITNFFISDPIRFLRCAPFHRRMYLVLCRNASAQMQQRNIFAVRLLYYMLVTIKLRQ
jgi:hypothetical protein